MSIVKEIVKSNGGLVRVQSKLNVGTIVTLWFQIASQSLIGEFESKESLKVFVQTSPAASDFCNVTLY